MAWAVPEVRETLPVPKTTWMTLKSLARPAADSLQVHETILTRRASEGLYGSRGPPEPFWARAVALRRQGR
jgi:hypothetical protein